MLHKIKILHPGCTGGAIIFLVLTLLFYFCISEGSNSRSPSRGPADMRPPLPIPSRQTVHQTNTEEDEVQNMNHNYKDSKFSGLEREHLSKLFFQSGVTVRTLLSAFSFLFCVKLQRLILSSPRKTTVAEPQQNKIRKILVCWITCFAHLPSSSIGLSVLLPQNLDE